MQTNGTAQRGFTLIELSMVLVVIGLIVGGLLVGQDLIRAAAVRATISQIEKYNTAVNTFRGKYGYLPGDIKDPEASQFGFQSRGQYAGEGDGNGVIQGIASNASGQNSGNWENCGEIPMFWADLSAAHLIDSTFNTASETSVPGSDITLTTTPNINAYLPQAKLGKGNYIYVWSGGISGIDARNYFGLSTVTSIPTPADGGGVVSGFDLSVQEAYAIDKKFDDGLPLSGKVLAIFLYGSVNYAGSGGPASLAQWPWSGSCYDNNGVAGAAPNYSVEQSGGNGLNCALSFQFQ